MTAPRLYLEDPLEALGQCLSLSSCFSALNGWGLVRVTGMNYPKREHWASCRFAADDLSDAVVRDGTIRQFSATVPALWEGGLDDWLDDLSELLNDHLLYEVYEDQLRLDAVLVDSWVREDIEPGPMPPFPWRPTL